MAPNDLLLATLWTQRSVEYRTSPAHRVRAGEDPARRGADRQSWTAAPGEQKGDFQNLPPAIVLDVDETLVDKLALPGMDDADQPDIQREDLERVLRRAGVARHPGAVEFASTPIQRREGVYVTNRGVRDRRTRGPTSEKLGFPMGGNVDNLP